MPQRMSVPACPYPHVRTRMPSQKARDLLKANEVAANGGNDDDDDNGEEEAEEEDEKEAAAEDEPVQCELCGKWCQNKHGYSRHRAACLKARQKQEELQGQKEAEEEEGEEEEVEDEGEEERKEEELRAMQIARVQPQPQSQSQPQPQPQVQAQPQPQAQPQSQPQPQPQPSLKPQPQPSLKPQPKVVRVLGHFSLYMVLNTFPVLGFCILYFSCRQFSHGSALANGSSHYCLTSIAAITA